jgi:hypothetical protein
MKNRFFQLAGTSFLALAMGWGVSSCTQDTDGEPQIGPSNNPVAVSFAPDSAASGEVVILKGTGLGDIRSIVFAKDSIQTGFQPNLNTSEVLIFRVPEEALGGVQDVIFTNSSGKSTRLPLRVLAYPSIASVSNYNFTAGTQITLTGNNLDDVTSVKLTGTSDAATIVSKAKKELVIKMPASSVSTATLDIVNSTGLMKTTQEFVNIDKALVIFGDAYGEGFADGSWGDAGAISTKEFKTGKASVSKNFQKGSWHLINFANWWPSIPYSADYKYLTMWIKGASEDYSLYITTDASKSGFGNSAVAVNKVDVKAGVWNYYKIKLSDIDFWSAGKTLKQIGFSIKGPDKQDEVFYFDDLMLVK